MFSSFRFALILTCLSWLGEVACQQNDTDLWADYEAGRLGLSPQTTYKSTTITNPLVHVLRRNSSCDSESKVLISPHGEHLIDNKILLLDNEGNLIWHHHDTGAIHNAQVQRYKGHDYITYWVGDDGFAGHGAGYYKMLDQTYTLAYTVSTANGLDGDYHEFTITPDDTALVTSYVRTPWNLTSRGIENGFIWDCVFQEVSISTNDLLFEWRASEHFQQSDMSVDSWTSWTGTSADPWDWFHLTSVQKDGAGNYLIAARYTNAITYISGKTGKRMWQLGGVRNSFRDVSGRGNARKISFVDPHMARWDDDERTALTVFDNIDTATLDKPTHHSRGVKIAMDLDRMTASATTELIHPDHVFARSDGSMQKLENGNYFISYGSAPVYSEFSPMGDLLCDTHFAPMDFAAEAVGTYRIYKARWTGFPTQAPFVKRDVDTLYVHWNGATEVKLWRLEGRDAVGGRGAAYKKLGMYKHASFETEMFFDQLYDYTTFRLTALDRYDTALGHWLLDQEGVVKELVYDVADTRGAITVTILPSHLLIVVAVVLFVARFVPLGRLSGVLSGRGGLERQKEIARRTSAQVPLMGEV